jgi:regulator of protease activity HflC (stomatin/prohibitin superfamily)
MGITLAIVGIILLVVAGVIAAKAWENDNRGLMGAMVAVCVVLLLFTALVPPSLHTVEAGEVAVVKSFGQTKEVKGAGLHFDFWIGKTYEYVNTKDQEMNIETMAYSSDAQVMTIQMTVQYRVLADKAMDIINTFGNTDALTSRITSVITEIPKFVVSERTAMDIIANRASITPEVEAAITKTIDGKYPVAITKVTITNIDFSDAFEQAVEKKMIAEQQKLQAEYENEKKLAAAEADAKAKIMAAEATAKANELLEKSLTDKILQEMYLNKWDGKLPSVVAGEDAALMLPATNY